MKLVAAETLGSLTAVSDFVPDVFDSSILLHVIVMVGYPSNSCTNLA